MDLKTLTIAFACAAIGLVAGFLLANSMNRTELSALRAEAEQLKSAGAGPTTDPGLTSEEISRTLARADQSPNDFELQQNIGVALYRYSAAKQDVELLKQTIRILERALQLKPNDHGIVLTLGNAHFDVGYFSKDNASLARARDFYARTLVAKPGDVDVQTDLALTYFLETPPDFDRTVIELRKSLTIDPKHEKTLQFITQALARQNKHSEATRFLEQLRAVNPANPSIPGLSEMLAKQESAG